MSRALVLVSLDWRRPKDPRSTLGHASLLARLAAEPDFDVRPISAAVNVPSFNQEQLVTRVLETATDGADIGIGVYVWNERVVRRLLSDLRRRDFRGRILLGGPQISYAPGGILDLYPEADAIIRGYAEDALAEWLRCRRGGRIPGVTHRGEADPAIPANTDLAQLPSPILTGITPVEPFMRWETQRGCIYACSFCQHRESGGRSRESPLAPTRVTAEIDALVFGGARDIAVLDPIFHTNPAALKILGRFASRGYTGRLSLQSRFELIDQAFLDACEGSNVRLEFGLQTANPAEMRAAGRMNDLAKAEATISLLHLRKIPFEVSLIYGLPEQTLGSFEASVRWCEQRGVPTIRAFPLMLLRGTKLDRDRHRWGLVESDDDIPVVLSSNSLSPDDVRRMRDIAVDLERATAAA